MKNIQMLSDWLYKCNPVKIAIIWSSHHYYHTQIENVKSALRRKLAKITKKKLKN